ncbi:MAG TPA: hypothetical protein VHC44_08870, partial [Verrucomicrobiae bacterium]|nr:hypothetical protein [Verrucomicrobiae bacterium]
GQRQSTVVQSLFDIDPMLRTGNQNRAFVCLETRGKEFSNSIGQKSVALIKLHEMPRTLCLTTSRNGTRAV